MPRPVGKGRQLRLSKASKEAVKSHADDRLARRAALTWARWQIGMTQVTAKASVLGKRPRGRHASPRARRAAQDGEGSALRERKPEMPIQI
jgi:hypothetical protein